MRRFAIALAVAASLYALPASAQDTVAATAEAQIVPPSVLTKVADLRFGTLVPGGTGGTIRIRPNGVVTTTGSVILAGGSRGPAAFNFQRTILTNFPTYGGPNGTATLLITNIFGDTMLVRNFETNFSFFGYFFQTSYTFYVGGTLDVAANQPFGHYEGEFNVTIDNY